MRSVAVRFTHQALFQLMGIEDLDGVVSGGEVRDDYVTFFIKGNDTRLPDDAGYPDGYIKKAKIILSKYYKGNK